jgi:ABC-type multidrug transport system fused ATPase/permease subunit
LFLAVPIPPETVGACGIHIAHLKRFPLLLRLAMPDVEDVPLNLDSFSLGPAKVKRLIVKNFRCIGDSPVEIDLDEIVVLVGANNAGKSTILRAYSQTVDRKE